MNINDKIYVAGSSGMVGSAIIRCLNNKGYSNIVTSEHNKIDLINQNSVNNFFENNKFDQVYLAAAKVGGIYANDTFPADFIYQNLMIQNNVINAAFSNNVKKLLFLGSSCIYPKNSSQPIYEDLLMTNKLEPTNEPYAIAKIAGIKLCESFNRQYGNSHGIDYRSIMPTNLYGPGDNYHPQNSHVIPALINRFHEAKLLNKPLVEVWGSGSPKREFLYVDDMASASVFLMNIPPQAYLKEIKPMQSHINAGSGFDISIKDLSMMISKIVGYNGNIRFDLSKPDGTLKKLMDSSKLNKLGWSPTVSLEDGLKLTYKDFKNKL